MKKKTYTDLTKALTERFAPAERSSVKKATLKARRRLPGETLVDFASAIRRLTAQAYGEKDPDLLDELARDYFVAGLNVELRVKVAESDPEALDAALRRAIHLEAIAEAEEGKRVPLQRMEYDRDIAVATVKSQTSEDRLLALMEQMQVTQQAILQAVSESGAVSTGAPCEFRLVLAVIVADSQRQVQIVTDEGTGVVHPSATSAKNRDTSRDTVPSYRGMVLRLDRHRRHPRRETLSHAPLGSREWWRRGGLPVRASGRSACGHPAGR